MRLLVVEDNIKLANSLKKGLTLEKFAVDIVHDSDEALSMALNEPYDLMIFDRMIPGSTDGIGVLTELRRAKISTPVIMLTARGELRDKVAGLNSGADDYLVKPFAFEELLARIHALLRRPAASRSSILKCADLSLDPQTFLVMRAGKRIDLTAKEFALLAYLIRNKDVTVTKDQLVAHVWDYDADILPNTVEVFIGYLRNKVDKPFKSQNLIQTVRGFGYKIGIKT